MIRPYLRGLINDHKHTTKLNSNVNINANDNANNSDTTELRE